MDHLMCDKQVVEEKPCGMESSLPLDDIRLKKKKKSTQLNQTREKTATTTCFGLAEESSHVAYLN
jgi:hypothetical protein